MPPPFTLGCEFEATVINSVTGEPIYDFNNTPHFTELCETLIQHHYLPAHTEFDAATVELVTRPCQSLNDMFAELTGLLTCTEMYLAKNNMTLLLLGIHPARTTGDLIITDKKRCFKSVPYMQDRGENCFYTSFQLNFEVPKELQDKIINLCTNIQKLMWPFTVICQSSSLFNREYTGYQSYRVKLNDQLSDLRAGPFPPTLKTLRDYHDYCRQLPNQENLIVDQYVWFDVLPKALNGNNHYRIELRAADTSTLPHMKYYSQAMLLNVLACLQDHTDGNFIDKIAPITLAPTRDNILTDGKHADILLQTQQTISLADYLNHDWRPWIQPIATSLNINVDELIIGLLSPTLAEECQALANKQESNRIALHFSLKNIGL